MATHSSILAWKIPWTEEPGGDYSPWGHKESDVTEHACTLVIQWLRLCTSTAGVVGLDLVLELKTHTLCSQKRKKKRILFYLLKKLM